MRTKTIKLLSLATALTAMLATSAHARQVGHTGSHISHAAIKAHEKAMHIAQIKGFDSKEALKAFRKACEMKNGHSCFMAYTSLKMRPEADSEAFQKEMGRLLARGCDSGSGAACYELAIRKATPPNPESLFSEEEVKKRQAQFRKNLSTGQPHFFLKKACGYGVASACVDLSRIATDKKLKKAWAEKACQIESSMCDTLSEVEGGVSTPQGRKVMLKTCSAGNPDACNKLADFFKKHHQAEQAVKFWTKGCEQDSPEACFQLAKSYEFGAGVSQDKAKALAIYRAACEHLGHQPSCRKAPAPVSSSRK